MGCVSDPREAERIIYAEVVRCAVEEITMTGQDDLSSLLGGSSVSTTVSIMHRLERKGLIRVKRYQRSRHVYVVEMDRWTAEPVNKSPHWRDVPRPTNLPTVALPTIAMRRPDQAAAIQTEIRRRGAMPADFIAELVHIGWHEYLAARAEAELARAA
jgi:hypothetical protein